MAAMTNDEAIAVLLRSDKYSTGQVARLVGVAPRTVAMWCDTGVLDSYRIPRGFGTKAGDAGDRRVTRAALVKFLQEHGMPLLPNTDPVLALFTNRKVEFDWPGKVSVLKMSDGWDSLVEYGRVYERHSQLYAVVVDLGYCPAQNASAILNYRPEEGRRPPHVIIVLSEDAATDEERGVWERRGAYAVVAPHQAWELLGPAVLDAFRQQDKDRREVGRNGHA